MLDPPKANNNQNPFYHFTQSTKKKKFLSQIWIQKDATKKQRREIKKTMTDGFNNEIIEKTGFNNKKYYEDSKTKNHHVTAEKFSYHKSGHINRAK